MKQWEMDMRAEIGKSLKPFGMYGMKDLIPGATKELIRTARKYSPHLLRERAKENGSDAQICEHCHQLLSDAMREE